MKLKDALANIISEAIDEDFWNEDSYLVDAYAETNNDEQLECDMRSIYVDGDKNITFYIGKEGNERKFFITIKEF